MGEEDPSAGAVQDVDRRHSHPGTQIVDGKRDILSVSFVENPDFSRRGRPGDPVAVVVEEEAVCLRISSERRTELFHVLHGWI